LNNFTFYSRYDAIAKPKCGFPELDFKIKFYLNWAPFVSELERHRWEPMIG